MIVGNGMNWQKLVHGSNIWLAASQVQLAQYMYIYVTKSTDDGKTWTTPQSVQNEIFGDLMFDGSRFVLVTRISYQTGILSYTQVSNDGLTYTGLKAIAQAGTGGAPNDFVANSLAYGNGTYMAVGQNNAYMFSNGNLSSNMEWSAIGKITTSATIHWQKVIYDGSRFIAISSGNNLSSGYIAIYDGTSKWSVTQYSNPVVDIAANMITNKVLALLSGTTSSCSIVDVDTNAMKMFRDVGYTAIAPIHDKFILVGRGRYIVSDAAASTWTENGLLTDETGATISADIALNAVALTES